MMNAQELDDTYTRLCFALTAVGEQQTPMVLARLALLLMQEVGNVERVTHAIDAAVDGFAAPDAARVAT